MTIHKIFLILFITVSGWTRAQQSAVYTSPLAEYHKALELYNNKQYLAAQNLFAKIRDKVDDEQIDADCSYYIANCAVWLNQKDADALMESFVANYPLSTKRNSAYLDVANYYFDNGKYAYARKWYDKVDEGGMTRAQRERFEFNNGYAYFKAQRFNEAKKYFNRVIDSKEYGSQAKYYLGFIEYEGNNYAEANKLFDEVKDLEQYEKNLSYFQSDMNFKSGKFEEAIAEGKKQLPTSSPKEKSELNKIIGESYFNLQQYNEAIPYLKEFKGRGGKWNNTDYYQLGYAYYKQGAYDQAIAEFNKIIDGRNATAQNAYYHLAESYLKSGQKQQALNAFKNASEMTFDTTIQEDAAYNYAKLSYEVGNSYSSVPEVLQAYLDTYPNSTHRDEINTLLIDSFITSKNYQAAIDLLEKGRKNEDKEVYQKVTFYRGLELYMENKYSEALSFFDKSLQVNVNPAFTGRATYWKAESQYLSGQYDAALSNFKKFKSLPEAKAVNEYEELEYAMAYTYFKQKQYIEAAQFFEAFVNASSNASASKKGDAYLRLGDSYFISSKYWPAMESYNKAIDANGAEADYAHYQKAISYGFVGKNDQKIQDLRDFLNSYNRSIYRDDAFYALGNVYVETNQNANAVEAYNKLINTMPGSSLVPKAILKKGLIFYNQDQSSDALENFKSVVSKYPGTPEAQQAVQTARLIYIDLGRTEEYAAWVKNLDFVEVSDADLDNTSYEAAEKQLVDGNEAKALAAYQKYINEFPNGIHALEAHFQVAEGLYKQGKKQEAIPHYQFVVNKKRNEYSEQSLLNLSKIYLEDKKFTEAIVLLKELESIADFAQNRIFAQSNLMKSYYQKKDYTQTVTYAEKVLQNPKIENNVKADAQIFIARSARQTGDESRMRSAYAEVQKTRPSGILGAEALYYQAYFQHQDGNHKESNETVQKLAKDFSGYKEYGAKGLVLMAKNFYALKDAYQATYILESVIKNFADYPEIIKEAQNELKRIKAEEAKTNSSVEVQQ